MRGSYRVKARDITTLLRETLIEADSPEEAREMAEEMDWREWDEIGRDTSAEIVCVEDENGTELLP